VINPNYKVVEGFKWAVLASLFPADDNAERISKYRGHIDKVLWKCIEFPADKISIKAFEEANPNTAINVLAWDGAVVYPWSLSKRRGKTANFLLITNENGSHYKCIEYLSRLLSSQVNV